jgi:hypothetical protein
VNVAFNALSGRGFRVSLLRTLEECFTLCRLNVYT